MYELLPWLPLVSVIRSALPLRPLVADRRLDAHDTGDAALPLRRGTLNEQADVTVMGRTPAQRVFLLSTASLSPIGSYAQLLIYGEESLSPEGGMLSMKFT